MFFKLLSFLFLIFSTPLLAQMNSSEFFQKGLKVNEQVFEFLSTHPCEIGLDKSCERPLSAKDLSKLKMVLKDLEEWRKIAFDGIVPLSRLEVDLPTVVTFGDKFSITQRSRLNPVFLKYETYLEIVLNPQEEESNRFIHKARQGTTTILLTYDSFFRLIQLISKATKIRSILQNDAGEESTILENTFSLAMNEKLWGRVTHAVQFLQAEKNLRGPISIASEDKIFDQYLEKSFTAKRMILNDMDYRVKTALFTYGQLGQSYFFEAINHVVETISRVFGNAAGTIQTRSGKLKDLAQDPSAMKNLKEKLKPLDILLEKTPFRLTDHFIPGYFGHVAIWLGSPDDLDHLEVSFQGKKIPLLSHPDVLPHLEKLAQGKLVLEALRVPGVTLNTLEHFLDIDDLVVLESPEMSDELKAEHLLRAFQQVGKPYDFNFNVETESEIVCSELIYRVYTDQIWPTSVSLSRYTISPDQVAWKAVDSCFNPIILYLDGEEISSNLKKEIRKVLELPGGIEYTPSGTCFGSNKFSFLNHSTQNE